MSHNNSRLQKGGIQNTSTSRFQSESTNSRKSKRNDQLKKFRAITAHVGFTGSNSLITISNCLQSIDLNVIRDGILSLQQLITIEGFNFQDVLSSNVMNILLNLLNCGNNDIVVECLVLLSNFASGEHNESSYISNSLPVLKQFFYSDDLRLREQVCWVVGNIAGDCDSCRLLNSAYSNDSFHVSHSIRRVSAWAMSNLLRGHTLTATEFLHEVSLKTLSTYLNTSDDQLLKEISWITTFLTAKDDYPLNDIMSIELFNNSMEVLHKLDFQHLACVPLMITSTNLLFRQDQSAFASAANMIAKYSANHGNKIVLKECLNFLAVYINTNETNAQIVAENVMVCQHIFSAFSSGLFDVRKSCLFIIRTLQSRFNLRMEYLTNDFIETLVECLHEQDIDIIYDSLALLKYISLTYPEYLEVCTSCGMMEAIDDIQYGNFDRELTLFASEIADKLYSLIEDAEMTKKDDDSIPLTDFHSVSNHGMGRGRSIIKPSWMNE